MSVLSAPPLPGGIGTFSIATWNIRSAQGVGLAAVAKGLCQIGIGCAVLTKTKLSNDQYSKNVEGYHMIPSKATSPQQGGIALLWTAEHWDFEVEAVKIASPNVLTFQLVTGGVHFFVMGAYIPTADTTGVDDLCAAWANGPMDGSPRTKQKGAITDLLKEINLVDMSCKYVQQWG